MFVYSVKGNTLKLAGIICLAAVLMLSLLLLVPKNGEKISDAAATEETAAASKEEKINYTKIKTNEDRIKFLEQFGWQVENEPTEEVTVKIPKTFDKVLSSYNNLQLHQGLDLTKYSGKEVSRYTYKVTNYPDYSGDVIANVIVYRNRVIGGDICSSDVDGFIRDFTFPGETGYSAETTVPENADTSAPESSETAVPDAAQSADTATPDAADTAQETAAAE